MADKKQDIYDKVLDNAKKTITNIIGPWNNLNVTYRLVGKLKNIARELQYKFFKGKYELDIFTEEQMSLENIRRIKKFGFNNNSGKLKLCTTHSFKGWESETLVLIIDKRDTHLTPELLYTAITRSETPLPKGRGFLSTK